MQLSKLAAYYLACLGHEEFSVSAFAQSNYALDYAEIADWKTVQSADFLQNQQAQQLQKKIRGGSGKALYVGYLIDLQFIQSRRTDWSGYLVEPFFLFPVEVADDGELKIDAASPSINPRVLKRLTHVTEDELLDQLMQLERRLGFSETEQAINLGDVARLLMQAHPEWRWVEPADLENLTTAPSLAQADQPGIYNRAVLIIGERSSYTRGLESELAALAKLPESDYRHTALGQWTADETIRAAEVEQASALMEVLPLNAEQRAAVQKSMRQNLTVITGPPGTGKSQVVTDLLINAAWQNKKILFASKNNKAVDVVEIRINTLGPRPILLRVGSNAYRTKLAEYLLGLLAATATDDDHHEFEESLEIQERLEEKVRLGNTALENTIELRNRLDALERKTESVRAELPTETIDAIKNNGAAEIKRAVKIFMRAANATRKRDQNFVRRLLWTWLKKTRFEKLTKASELVAPAASCLGIELPDGQVDDENLLEWQSFAENLKARMQCVKQFGDYIVGLRKLQQAPAPESIAREQANIAAQLANNAESLWRSWLRLQPSKLSDSDRRLLNQYRASLEMVIDSNPNEQLSREVYRRYIQLLPKVSHLLPCWAVTSLSARRMVPFEAGFFDMVVFDEASQCDIASALPLLYRAKRAIVIGDPKQLRHISKMKRGQDMHLLEKYDLATDHVNWAYSHNSLFDLAVGMVAGDNIVTLRDHHRSHADIINFSNRFFYEDRLRVATRYNNLRGGIQGIRWLQVQGDAIRPDGGGAANMREAEKIVQTLEHLVVEKNYSGSIGVVSPFRAQANLIRQLINAKPRLEQKLIGANFLSDTVHKFQGDERDMIIFSPVLSAETPAGALGFLRHNGNLFNVAITRARAALVVVGDSRAAVQSDIDYYREFAVYIQSLEQTSQVRHEQKTETFGSDYPTVANPERVSDWERILYRALHQAGVHSVPQYQADQYQLDLAVFDGERKLNVEVDGERYHRDWNGELCRRDQIRNFRMFELGWDVLRFWVYEVRDDLDGCVRRVGEWKNADK